MSEIYKTDNGTYIIIGKILDSDLYDELKTKINSDETVIEIPVDIVNKIIASDLSK